MVGGKQFIFTHKKNSRIKKKSLQKDDKLHITGNGQDIEMKEEVEYLGVVLDQALKCSCIIDKIVSTSINKLKFIYKKTKGFN